MAPKHTQFTANVDNKKLHSVTDLETILEVIKYYKGRKSGMLIACLSGMSKSTIAMILKSKNKVIKSVKGYASLKALRLKNVRRDYIRHGETSNGLKARYRTAFLLAPLQPQLSKNFVSDIKRKS